MYDAHVYFNLYKPSIQEILHEKILHCYYFILSLFTILVAEAILSNKVILDLPENI